MEEEEAGRKRADEESGGNSGEGFVASKRKKEVETDDELNDEVIDSWLSLKGSEGDSMSELLKLLDDSSEVTTSASSSWATSPTSCGVRVRFSDNPYSSALIFQSSSSFVTINGNEESCGSSFSDSDSSMMASVDMGGMMISTKVMGGSSLEEVRGWLEGDEEGGVWGKSEEEARGWVVDWDREWDEEQLARFLDKEGYLF